MTRILVCDDIGEDLDNITNIIESFYNGAAGKEISAPHILTRFSSSSAVIAYIENGNAVDIAVLDIMMPGMNGMDLAFELREMGFSGYLIFLTTFNDFAAQSYAVQAFSYILKPAEKENVWKLLDNIENIRRANDHNGFSLTRKNGTRFVLFSELMYVEVVNHTLHFHLIDGEVVKIYGTLRDFSETLLREKQMLKPQKSFIVNLDYVRSCENRALFMRDGIRISVPKDFETLKEKWLERVFG